MPRGLVVDSATHRRKIGAALRSLRAPLTRHPQFLESPSRSPPQYQAFCPEREPQIWPFPVRSERTGGLCCCCCAAVPAVGSSARDWAVALRNPMSRSGFPPDPLAVPPAGCQPHRHASDSWGNLERTCQSRVYSLVLFHLFFQTSCAVQPGVSKLHAHARFALCRRRGGRPDHDCRILSMLPHNGL
jgi:hypothetical protein